MRQNDHYGEFLLTPEMEVGLQMAVGAAGNRGWLARDLGISRSTVWRWKRIPAEYCAAIEKLYDVPRAVLRPDLFGDGA